MPGLLSGAVARALAAAAIITVPVPAGLGWTPSDFSIKAQGNTAWTDFDMAAVKPVPDYIYYCSPTGSASASPASNDPATPVTPRRVVDLANAHGGNIKVFLAGGLYYGNKSFNGVNLTCASLTAEPWVGQGSGRPIQVQRNTNAAATWVLDTGTTYYTTHSTSGTTGVYDLVVKDSVGAYTRLPYAPDLATCRATPGTCYWDSAASRMYVNPADGRNLIGTENMIVTTNNRSFLYNSTNNSLFWGTGIDFIGGFSLQQSTATKTGKVYAQLCGFYGGDGSSTGSFSTNGPVTVRLIQCFAGGSIEDAFNYHGNAAGDPQVLEDRCHNIFSGYNTTGANNATTIHENGRLICVGGVYAKTQNRTIHNIQTSKAFYVFCSVEGSAAADATSWTITAGGANGQSTEIWLYGIGPGGIANSVQGGLYAYTGCAIRYANGSFGHLTTGGSGTITSYTP